LIVPYYYKITYTGSGSYSNSFIYSQISGSLTITKCTPTITALPCASVVIYGKSLLSSNLSGGIITNINNSATVVGSWSFTNINQNLTIGQNIVNVTFTPNDTVNYNSCSVNIFVLVIVPNTISSLSMPLNISLHNNTHLNIYNLNPSLPYNTYKFYSSDNSIAEIDLSGNIKPKKVGKFHIIVTNMQGLIIYTTPYFIEVIKLFGGSGGVNMF
jgi:hypothetical protein